MNAWGASGIGLVQQRTMLDETNPRVALRVSTTSRDSLTMRA
jgi:hypothetical protein